MLVVDYRKVQSHLWCIASTLAHLDLLSINEYRDVLMVLMDLPGENEGV